MQSYCIKVELKVIKGDLNNMCIDRGFKGNKGSYINC